MCAVQIGPVCQWRVLAPRRSSSVHATIPLDISWKMRETTGAGARQPRERKRVEMARESRCSVHRTGHGASLR